MKKNPNEKTVRPKVVKRNIKTLKCPECGDMFEKPVGLSIHIGRKHPDVMKVANPGRSQVQNNDMKDVTCDVERCKFSCKESELNLHME